MSWFSSHSHSELSVLDGMQTIPQMVAKAKAMGQPALGLTDHGNMTGSFQLYKHCRKAGILPFPGCEIYLTNTLEKDEERHHLTLNAINSRGYTGLVKLITASYVRPAFYRKPRVDLGMLGEFLSAYGHDVSVMTGCYFGMLQQKLAHGDTAGAENFVRWLQAKGHADNVFVEIQHHHTDHDIAGVTDDWMADASWDVATKTNSRVMVTQDCHYLDESDHALHGFMKGVAYRSDPSEVGFPGDSYHLASDSWVAAHYKERMHIWDAGVESCEYLLSRNQVEFPFLDTYQYHIPQVDVDPDGALIGLCEARMAVLGLTSDVYQARLDYEIDTISLLGFSSYFLLVNDYVEFARSKDIFVMARGSAGGSLVAFLLEFTQTDPVVWDLSFDRFLTPDRIRPPDIDLDIEDVRRDEVLEYLRQSFSIAGIGTYQRVGVDTFAGKGSLLQMWLGARRKTTPEEEWAVSPLKSVRTLHDVVALEPKSAESIIDLSGRFLGSYGAHAAGFIIDSKDHPLADWVPTMLIASSDTTVTQMAMDDVEDAGFIKLDLLGLRSLTTVRRCLGYLGKTDLDWIPLDDRATIKFLRKGRRNNGIFQFEGYSAAKGCRQVKPTCIADLILINALYRPAAMESGYTDQFLRCRNGEEEPSYPHPIFEKHLAITLGVPAFQDQALDILRELGMPVAELNAFLKAVKVKGGNAESSDAIFQANRAKFRQLCSAVGMSPDAIDQAWSLIEGFAAYGFNRAHATAYSVLGYQMAYLSVHHKLEFFAALLETAPKKKAPDYIEAANKAGVPLLPVDVNKSLPEWSIDWSSGGIRRGISDISGVGAAAATEIVAHAPFDSIEDLIDRCENRAVNGGKEWSKNTTLKGTLLKLQFAGALESIGIGQDQ